VLLFPFISPAATLQYEGDFTPSSDSMSFRFSVMGEEGVILERGT
jgi:hypothetical protein